MKKFNASDLSKKPSKVFEAARGEGALIQHKDRQGNVVEEFYLVNAKNTGSISVDGIKDPLLVINQNILYR